MVYEVGYHILPTVPEEEVAKEVSEIRTLIVNLEGNIISEGVPALKPLAYDIAKKIETKVVKFNKAYFGWVKFEMDPGSVLNLKNKIEALPNILRFLIIKTVKENTLHTPKIPTFRKESEVSEAAAVVEAAPKAPASEAEIDKSIDDLVIS